MSTLGIEYYVSVTTNRRFCKPSTGVIYSSTVDNPVARQQAIPYRRSIEGRRGLRPQS